MNENIVLCIDLGTTNSAMAYINPRTDRPETIQNEEEEHTTPSVVLFLENEIIVGRDAINNAWENPDGLVSCIKRFMGNHAYELEFFGTKHTPETISALILQKLKADAEAALNTSINEAMITVPAYFDDHQRKATIEAAGLAGLNVDQFGIINEPTAAALYYGLDHAGKARNVMVYDLGGGTFDITLLNIAGNELNVVTSTGNAQLGGKDWDVRIIDHVAEKFKAAHGVDLREDALYANQLEERAEKAKRELSARSETTVAIAYENKNLKVTLSRQEFEDMTRDLLFQTESLVTEALDSARLKWKDVAETILAGGSTRMPMVKEMLQRLSGKEPLAALNPDLCVALGAAAKSSKDSMIIVRDVTAHSLGMVSLEGNEVVNTIMIPKDSTIPCSFKKEFTNPRDNMTELDVKLLQGEDRDPNLCTLLKHHIFKGIAPLPRNQEQIEVTFSYTVNGTVDIEAVDLKTGDVLDHEEKELADLMLEPLPSEAQPGGPTSVALVIDCSYSMAGTPIDDAKKAAIKFVKDMLSGRENIQICVVTVGGQYSQDTRLVHPLSSDKGSLIRTIKSLAAGSTTPMDEAIGIGCDELADAAGKRYMVIVSDGMPNDEDSAVSEATRAQKAGLEITTIGIDAGEHNRFLRDISTLDHYEGIESGKLSDVFDNIFQVLNQ
ncbi:MAG: Hsp70 family protein [bacterium]